MKTQKLIIKGEEHTVKMFRTLRAAQNFINKKEGRSILYFESYEYYVEV